LVALAQAYDSAGRAIYGVDYSWAVDGQTEIGLGDLYRYTFDPKLPKALAATFDGHDAVAMIHSGGGFVDSSNNLGCSAVPGGAARPVALLLVAAALALCLRRRRQ
jgi:MYXO-CTERM domain-containing protein